MVRSQSKLMWTSRRDEKRRSGEKKQEPQVNSWKDVKSKSTRKMRRLRGILETEREILPIAEHSSALCNTSLPMENFPDSISCQSTEREVYFLLYSIYCCREHSQIECALLTIEFSWPQSVHQIKEAPHPTSITSPQFTDKWPFCVERTSINPFRSLNMAADSAHSTATKTVWTLIMYECQQNIKSSDIYLIWHKHTFHKRC